MLGAVLIRGRRLFQISGKKQNLVNFSYKNENET